MSSAGRAVSSSGCVGRPRGHETGLTGYAESIQYSSPTGSSAMETAEHREPYESRGSRTDLGAPGGENPPGDSTTVRAQRCHARWLNSADSGHRLPTTQPDITGSAYSITSSARARINGGIVRPSALAVLRLMVSLNVVGCSIGRSAG